MLAEVVVLQLYRAAWRPGIRSCRLSSRHDVVVEKRHRSHRLRLALSGPARYFQRRYRVAMAAHDAEARPVTSSGTAVPASISSSFCWIPSRLSRRARSWILMCDSVRSS